MLRLQGKIFVSLSLYLIRDRIFCFLGSRWWSAHSFFIVSLVEKWRGQGALFFIFVILFDAGYFSSSILVGFLLLLNIVKLFVVMAVQYHKQTFHNLYDSFLKCYVVHA